MQLPVLLLQRIGIAFLAPFPWLGLCCGVVKSQQDLMLIIRVDCPGKEQRHYPLLPARKANRIQRVNAIANANNSDPYANTGQYPIKPTVMVFLDCQFGSLCRPPSHPVVGSNF